MTRRVPLLALVLVSGCAAGPGDRDWPSAGAWYRGSQAELEPVAGMYVYDLGGQRRLHVSDDGEYADASIGCLGSFVNDRGDTEVKDGWLVLSSGKNGRTRLLPVRWGERLYLVEERELLDFCAKAGSGEEPRDSAGGMFFLRDGDWNVRVTGLPELPSKWLEQVQAKALYGKVIDIAPDGTAGVSLGAADGMREGMTLFIDAGDGWVEVAVARVLEKECRVKPRVEAPEGTIAVGRRVVSRKVDR